MIDSEHAGRIFKIKNQREFLKTALEVFHYQYNNNRLYRDFCINLGRGLEAVNSVEDIPFIPVEFFRNHKIITGCTRTQIVFESSGTTGVVPGKHFVSDLTLYEESFITTFSRFYGNPDEYLILALLPSYTERKGSSLVYMVNKLVEKSTNPKSGFYKENSAGLIRTVTEAKEVNSKILIFGVSFALLDLAEKSVPNMTGVIIMETGGMKGRRKELTRQELHKILMEKLKVDTVHSEYGMTELLSQAYSAGEGIFHCPAWMKIMIRDPQDPLTIYDRPRFTGGINIIDLANINSCSFIATNDLGRLHEDGGFEVLGRFDNSDIRGCNLMAE